MARTWCPTACGWFLFRRARWTRLQSISALSTSTRLTPLHRLTSSINTMARSPQLAAVSQPVFRAQRARCARHKSHSARVSLRYKIYTAHIASDAQLHSAFKSRLLDIAANVQNNNTKLAHYLAETLVRDYGTHVITSIDAGAGLSKTTFVSRNFLQNEDEEKRSLVISECAGAGFLFWHVL